MSGLKQKIGGKNILLFSVKLFDYEKFIAQRLKFHGANVDYFDERPKNTLYAKGIIRLNPSFYKKTITTYYKKVLSEIQDRTYDYILVIKGEVIPEFFLREIKRLNPASESIFYTWDAFSNYKNAESILHLFDKAYSFDINDAKKYQLEFRPLFFIDAYKKIGDTSNVERDLLFVGTAHSDRYEISQKLVSICNKNKLKTYTFYFIQSPLVYLFKRLFDKTFSKIDLKELSFKSLSKSKVVELVTTSKAILDIQHPNQRGLTMRTFEALGAECKLITTNADIMNYTFYNPDNICIIDRDKISIIPAFFRTNFVGLNEDMKYLMSIDGWLECLFVNNKHKSYWYKS